ncbi:hypothetical protein BDW22DRAFT_1417865 [Trametopsis cervina]|nr:hypothetical protein BDW22DRAFT_1417865 [Trametopsis cervina]
MASYQLSDSDRSTTDDQTSSLDSDSNSDTERLGATFNQLAVTDGLPLPTVAPSERATLPDWRKAFGQAQVECAVLRREITRLQVALREAEDNRPKQKNKANSDIPSAIRVHPWQDSRWFEHNKRPKVDPSDYKARYKTEDNDQLAYAAELFDLVKATAPKVKKCFGQGPWLEATWRNKVYDMKCKAISATAFVFPLAFKISDAESLSKNPKARKDHPDIMAIRGRPNELYPPMFFKNKDKSKPADLFMIPAIGMYLRVIYFGQTSLARDRPPRNTKGTKWGITREASTPGELAFAAVAIQYHASGEETFIGHETLPGKIQSEYDFRTMFESYKRFFVSNWDKPQTQRVINLARCIAIGGEEPDEVVDNIDPDLAFTTRNNAEIEAAFGAITAEDLMEGTQEAAATTSSPTRTAPSLVMAAEASTSSPPIDLTDTPSHAPEYIPAAAKQGKKTKKGKEKQIDDSSVAIYDLIIQMRPVHHAASGGHFALIRWHPTGLLSSRSPDISGDAHKTSDKLSFNVHRDVHVFTKKITSTGELEVSSMAEQCIQISINGGEGSSDMSGTPARTALELGLFLKLPGPWTDPYLGQQKRHPPNTPHIFGSPEYDIIFAGVASKSINLGYLSAEHVAGPIAEAFWLVHSEKYRTCRTTRIFPTAPTLQRNPKISRSQNALIWRNRLADPDPTHRLPTEKNLAHLQPAQYLSHITPNSTTATLMVTNPEKQLAGHQTIVPCDASVGGGSSINFMMHTCVGASNYNGCQNTWENAGWGSQNMITLLKKVVEVGIRR